MRQKHALAGLAMFALSSVFVCYLCLEKIDSIQVFSALLWITGLFSAFNTMQKSLTTEKDGTILWLYTFASPTKTIAGKLIYNALLVMTLNILALIFFLLFFGGENLHDAGGLQLLVVLLLGSTGLSGTLTFVSSLSFKSGSSGGLVTVLGFPLIIPLLITLSRSTTLILEGASWAQNSYNILVLAVLNGSSIVLTLILFPFLWKD